MGCRAMGSLGRGWEGEWNRGCPRRAVDTWPEEPILQVYLG